MSMMNDITYSVTSFCIQNKLDRSKAVELLTNIVNDLEWDYTDEGEVGIDFWISREWENDENTI